MKKICICGHFGGNKDFYDGQTVKTKSIYEALLKKYSENEIYKIDTYNWRKNPIKFLVRCIKGHKNSSNIIILPAQNGVKIFIPLFLFLNIFLKRKIFYIVIGGWLPNYIQKKKFLTKKLRKLNKIFVETTKMKKDLKKLEINNTDILVNFKNIQPINIKKLELNFDMPYKLCTFSRVMKEKGIEDAINVVKQINEEANKIIYTLDIYGQIDSNYKDKFEILQKDFPEYIKYKGCIDSNKAVEVISKYFLLSFPTRFKTEGLPGTLIDAYNAGVPVIASNWNSSKEFVEENKTGLIYEFENQEDLKKKIEYAIENKEKIENMRDKCKRFSHMFRPEEAIKPLLNVLDL